MAAIDDLKASQVAITSAVEAAVAEIQSLAARLGGNADDADVEAVAAGLNTLAANLQAAVAAAPSAPAAPAPAA